MRPSSQAPPSPQPGGDLRDSSPGQRAAWRICFWTLFLGSPAVATLGFLKLDDWRKILLNLGVNITPQTASTLGLALAVLGAIGAATALARLHARPRTRLAFIAITAAYTLAILAAQAAVLVAILFVGCVLQLKK